MHLPRLYVIAGPNGVGKSLFSSALTEINDVFNGDALVLSMEREFPLLSKSALRSLVDGEMFEVAKTTAINANADFAFETNFTADLPTHSVREFRAAGYMTNLIFISVPFIEECHQRVKQRVRRGGHSVDSETITWNFSQSYQNLYQYFPEFDNVSLWNNPVKLRAMSVPVQLCTWSRHTMVCEVLARKMPDWAQAFVAATERHRGLHEG